jgi:hypothetical protein
VREIYLRNADGKIKTIFILVVLFAICGVAGAQTAGAGPFSKGTIEERRKAIKEAAARKSTDPQVIEAIIAAMTQTAGDIEPDTSPAPILPDPSADLKKAVGLRPALLGACSEALLTIGQPAYQSVVHGLQNENRWVRYGCTWYLGRLGNKDAVRPLCGILEKKTEDMNVIIEVAESLRLLGDPGVTPSVERTLQTLQMGHAGFYALLELLARTDPPMAAKWCNELSKSTQPAELRQVAAQVSGLLADRVTADVLLSLLADSDAGVRIQAARAIGRRKETQAEARLLSLAKNAAENGGVRVHAAWALARLGHDDGTKILQKLASDGPDFAKVQAKSSLEALDAGKPDNVPEGHDDPKKFARRFLDLGGGLYVSVE